MKYVEAIGHTLFVWNRAKHFAFQTQVLEKHLQNKYDERGRLYIEILFTMKNFNIQNRGFLMGNRIYTLRLFYEFSLQSRKLVVI
ncbi:hypothetical protein ACFDTO_13760 [Microbacteriaceae bacterium 4G12]